jgi:Flp pilus assembly protein TadB
MSKQLVVSSSAPVLESEKVVVSAPMSFAGSAQRVWKLTRDKEGGPKIAFVIIAFLILSIWWPLIAAWYLLFGILLVPYRLLRRGSRKRKRQALQHREMLAAIDQKKA